MKLVLLYIVLSIGFVELALFCIKGTYRGDRAQRFRRQILLLSRKDNPMAYHNLSIEIAVTNLLSIKLSCLPDEVKWKILPLCIVASLLLAGILLWGAFIFGLFPPFSTSMAMLVSWATYRLMMACSDRIASKKNLIANVIRAEKFAGNRKQISRAYLAISLAIGLIVYYLFS